MPRNNELPSYESLLEFQEVYVLAIALAWRDPVFKQALLDNPTRALEDYYGYKCPWNVNLKVREPADKNQGWDEKQQQWHLPRDSISIGIPAKPKDQSQAIALANYNDAGPTYLFTCC